MQYIVKYRSEERKINLTSEIKQKTSREGAEEAGWSQSRLQASVYVVMLLLVHFFDTAPCSFMFQSGLW